MDFSTHRSLGKTYIKDFVPAHTEFIYKEMKSFPYNVVISICPPEINSHTRILGNHTKLLEDLNEI